jgi:reactive intermediate/imine deaminase
MSREVIRTDDAPSSPLYSQAVKAGGFLFVSGIVGIDPTRGGLAGDTIQAQTRQAIANCAAVLNAAGASLADVVEVGVLIANPDDFGGMNEAYAETFSAEPPARYVARLGPVLPGVLVSVRMTAVAS